MRKALGVMAGLLTATVTLAGPLLACGQAGAAESASGSNGAKAPYTIALVTSTTGLAAPLFQETPQGFLARIALQNAQGGVNGHKLVPIVINDQTSPSLDATGVQLAISRGAIGIVAVSSLFYGGYKFAQQAGVPVTGSSLDGPEWGEQPNTNMFASDTGSIDPKYPANTAIGAFLKAHGGTIAGTYGIGISPSSIQSAIGTGISFQHAGGKVGVLDTSVPYGSVDFTSAALTAKSKKVNAVYAGMGNNQNFALATAFEQAGVKLKAVVFPTGYEAAVIKTPAWRSLAGDVLQRLVPAHRPAQCRHPPTGERTAEVPAPLAGQLPHLRRGRVLAGRRPHDQGAAEGRTQAPPGPRSSRPSEGSRPTTGTVCCRSPSTTRPSSATTCPSSVVGTSRRKRTGSSPSPISRSAGPTSRGRRRPRAER